MIIVDENMKTKYLKIANFPCNKCNQLTASGDPSSESC